MKAHQASYPVRVMCKLLGVSPSGFYAYVGRAPSRRAVARTLCQRATTYLRQHPRLTISTVTVFEVVRGWSHAGRTDRADGFLQWVSTAAEVIPFDTECAAVAGRLGGPLSRNGIGLADVMIAATAITHQVPVATGNRAHYQRALAFGLIGVENWRE